MEIVILVAAAAMVLYLIFLCVRHRKFHCLLCILSLISGCVAYTVRVYHQLMYELSDICVFPAPDAVYELSPSREQLAAELEKAIAITTPWIDIVPLE